MPERGEKLIKRNDKNIPPSTVAAISAALVAGGYIDKQDKITSVRKKNLIDKWKKSGILKQMLERELTINKL